MFCVCVFVYEATVGLVSSVWYMYTTTQHNTICTVQCQCCHVEYRIEWHYDQRRE